MSLVCKATPLVRPCRGDIEYRLQVCTELLTYFKFTISDAPVVTEEPTSELMESHEPMEPALDAAILDLLGDEPEKDEDYGEDIHTDLASRWCDVLVNGLKDEKVKDICLQYKVPANLLMALPPTLNPEVKAAINDNITKRDKILEDKQAILGKVIAILAHLTSTTLSLIQADPQGGQNQDQIKLLSNAGRLLCHIHAAESKTRKQFIIACLNKDIKETIKDLKRDKSLFGAELVEKLKSLKAISRTGAEMKINKPITPATPASTGRALNWRGPPPPPPPPQPAYRRTVRQPPTTTGGRRPPQQPMTTARRVSEKKQSKPYHRGHRR